MSKYENQVLETVVRFKHDLPNLIAVLDKLEIASLSESEQETWFYYRGILELKQGRRDQALSFFQKGKDRFPDSGALNFSLGMEFEAKGQSSEMADCFSAVSFDNTMPSLILLVIHILYLWGYVQEAQRKAIDMVQVYRSLDDISDDAVMPYGLPSVGYAFDILLCLSLLLDRSDEALAELAELKDAFPESDFTVQDALIRAYIHEEWTPLIDYLNATNKEEDAVNATLLNILHDTDEESIEERLSALSPSDTNYWLTDIQNYALAFYAFRTEESEMEQEFLKLFLNRQSLLLDPSYVLRFGFLFYQERVKDIYQDYVKKGHENPILKAKVLSFAFQGLPDLSNPEPTIEGGLVE